MKKRFLLILCAILCVNIISCAGNQKKTEVNKKENLEKTSVQNDFEKEEVETESYEDYSGDYSIEKLLVQDYKYGTIMNLKIDAEGNVEGTITSMTENCTHMAEVNFKGKVDNNVIESDFDEDGWGHRGTIKIELKDDYLQLTTKYTKTNDDASSLWGIGEASYKMIKNNTEVKRTLQDLIDGGLQIIDSQTFNTKLDNYGYVKFISGLKRENASEIFAFYIADNNHNILYKLPSFSGNDSGFADQVNCIAFRDFNGDGNKDILIICNYKNFEGEYIKHAGIYMQNENKFIEDEELTKTINDSGCNDKMENVISFLNE